MDKPIIPPEVREEIRTEVLIDAMLEDMKYSIAKIAECTRHIEEMREDLRKLRTGLKILSNKEK